MGEGPLPGTVRSLPVVVENRKKVVIPARHVHGAHARDTVVDNVRLSTQAMYVRVATLQQQQHHHHHQITTPTSSSLFSVVSGPRGCQQQRAGGVRSKSHSSSC